MKVLHLLFTCWLLFGSFSVVAQKPSDDRVGVIGPARCHDYGAVLDVIAQNTPPDKLIIVIARLGESESRPNINRRRLHNVRAHWTDYRLDKRKPETVILAEGERVKDYGRLEIYVGGKMAAILQLKRDADLVVGNCYPDVPFCDDKYNKVFYPCRERNLRGRKGR